jgi:hypothetical protein
MTNFIKAPTRITSNSQTLIDPIAGTNIIFEFDSGIFETTKEVSDHFGTYIFSKINFDSNKPLKRRV